MLGTTTHWPWRCRTGWTGGVGTAYGKGPGSCPVHMGMTGQTGPGGVVSKWLQQRHRRKKNKHFLQDEPLLGTLQNPKSERCGRREWIPVSPIFFLWTDSAAFKRPQLCVVSPSGVKFARMDDRFSCSAWIGVAGDSNDWPSCSRRHIEACSGDKGRGRLFTISNHITTMHNNSI